METRFSNEALVRIIEEATVYMCACPAQVCEQIQRLRGLVAYQTECMKTAGPGTLVSHHTIAVMAAQAHATMEECLDRVLELEGWDRATCTMPAGLRELQFKEIQGD
ncbi:MAG: hypothetical protein EG825_01740 [Rhodocyclaceae bacterium]|nr:hypothetical protein [Rhodocyclaceae bacterium]